MKTLINVIVCILIYIICQTGIILDIVVYPTLHGPLDIIRYSILCFTNALFGLLLIYFYLNKK